MKIINLTLRRGFQSNAFEKIKKWYMWPGREN